ncbi:MAG: glycosyltransferase family 2 protein [Geminicoccaceae bacterium]
MALPELAVIVPTFNERENVARLVERLDLALRGLRWEAIFVDDDSPDGTAARVRELAAADPRLRCIRRIGRRGLSSACIEGMLATSAPFVAVLDADLQHDETLLPAMLDILRRGDADLVVGSRYAAGGAVDGWQASRQRLSRTATAIARVLGGGAIDDPLSGFFMLPRAKLDALAPRLSGIGFKILLDILASAPAPLRVTELPYRFRPRHAGRSKLDMRAMSDFALLLADKLVGRWLPPRFVLFGAVGAVGIVVHLVTLAALHRGLGEAFTSAQAIATLVAMVFNFALNNAFTYRDRQLRGIAWWRGLATFVLACGIGAAANVGAASALYRGHASWLLSALGGVAVGAVWNYAITSIFTWRSSRRR